MKKKQYNEYLYYALAELFIVAAISLALIGIARGIRFTASYMWLYFLPGVPLLGKIDLEPAARLVLVNFFGLLATTVSFFLVGFLFVRLSVLLFIAIPAVIAGITFILARK